MAQTIIIFLYNIYNTEIGLDFSLKFALLFSSVFLWLHNFKFKSNCFPKIILQHSTFLLKLGRFYCHCSNIISMDRGEEMEVRWCSRDIFFLIYQKDPICWHWAVRHAIQIPNNFYIAILTKHCASILTKLLHPFWLNILHPFWLNILPTLWQNNFAISILTKHFTYIYFDHKCYIYFVKKYFISNWSIILHQFWPKILYTFWS